MTIEELYRQLHGNYADAKNRLMTDRLIEKFVLKFPADPTMQELNDAIAAGDDAVAFRAVHTLKGVAANLAFTELQKAASELTEQLRTSSKSGSSEGAIASPELYDNVKAVYSNIIAAINDYQLTKVE